MTRFFTVLMPLIAAATPALAAPVAEARFAPGTEVPAKIVVNDRLWSCADGRCTGPGETRAVAMQRACTTLARQVGQVATLTAGANGLTPAAVDACNAKAGRAPAALAAK